jgi:hypothetical protein
MPAHDKKPASTQPVSLMPEEVETSDDVWPLKRSGQHIQYYVDSTSPVYWQPLKPMKDMTNNI